MAFPSSVEGAFSVRKTGAVESCLEEAIARIARMLAEARATCVSREERTVNFTVAFFRFVFNWNILVPFDSGTIEVEDQGAVFNVKFRASTFRMLIIVSIAMCLGVAGVAVLSRGSVTTQSLALMFIIGWTWLFGANYAIAALRFPLWLRRGLERA